LLPLVQDLPIQFTDTPDKASREKGVFKNARGWLRGWELDPEEAERIKKMPHEPEIVLKRRPRKLFIEMQSASKDLPLVNEKRIYTLLAKPKEWSLDGQGNVKITRYGFSIVPDFGGTAHFYCGTSLDACIGDLLPWWRKPQMDDQLRGYIIKSRVRDASKLLTTQPYSPHLFRQGILPGPNLLHETLMKRMTPEEAKAAWRDPPEADPPDPDPDPQTQTLQTQTLRPKPSRPRPSRSRPSRPRPRRPSRSRPSRPRPRRSDPDAPDPDPQTQTLQTRTLQTQTLKLSDPHNLGTARTVSNAKSARYTNPRKDTLRMMGTGIIRSVA
jgi:hypothetical protein